MRIGHRDTEGLGRASASTLSLLRRPRAAAIAGITLATALAWVVMLSIGRVEAEFATPDSLGPGAGLLRYLPDLVPQDVAARLLSLCTDPVPLDGGIALRFAALTAMWFVMALAMMLPSAAPLVVTYGEIAETAAAKGEPAVSTMVLVAGYLSVWLGVSAVFAAATLAARLAIAMPAGQAAAPFAAAAALAVAGAYQFSALKQACLTKCRNPFALLFSRWSPRPGRIFRLGAEQGLWCVGCCWALMLVMFVVGVMNPLWMALLGMLALVEKTGAADRAGRIAGAILLVWAAALFIVSLR